MLLAREVRPSPRLFEWTNCQFPGSSIMNEFLTGRLIHDFFVVVQANKQQRVLLRTRLSRFLQTVHVLGNSCNHFLDAQFDPLPDHFNTPA